MEELELHVMFQAGDDYIILTEPVNDDKKPKWGVSVNTELKTVTVFEDFRRMIKFVPYTFIPKEDREGILKWIRQHFGQDRFIEKVVSPLMKGFTKEEVGFLEASSALVNGEICKNCEWKGCKILKQKVDEKATCKLWLASKEYMK